MSRSIGMLPLAASLFGVCLLSTSRLAAADSVERSAEAVAAGHSYHGEAFNEGPRQAAELLDGIANLDFPTSAKEERTQAFIEQGVAQLHGFWYLEAERSFRQAAAAEPELAIAYWGMAMANTNNQSRARGLIDQAMELREAGASPREKRYIEALDRYLGPAEDSEQATESKEEESDEPKRKAKPQSKEEKAQAEKDAKRKRAERYLSDLEQILHEFPEDIEAKALLAVQLWMFEREGVTMPSRYAVDALLGDVFAANPMHPAHHYRIHLWDRQRPQNALESAALCGPSMPAVAHMWHMPGHIYSRLHRYADAAWQQEASARVDHAHISRARLLPDQIHNFAHNNEWLTRNLIHTGRVEDALEQARNLVSLPQHPKYNSMKKGGSFKYGHQRLLQVLTTYGLWKELTEEAAGPYLAVIGDAKADRERTAWLAVAHLLSDNRREGRRLQRELQTQRLKLQESLLQAQAAEDSPAKDASATPEQEKANAEETGESTPPAETRSVAKLKAELKELNIVLARVAAAAAALRKDSEAVERHAKAAKLDKILQACWLAQAGDLKSAAEVAAEAVKAGEGEVPPLAVLVDVLWQQGKQEEAQKRFAELQKLACDADLTTPLLARLAPVAAALKAGEDWGIDTPPAKDLGKRPPLDQLGPFRWEPPTAPAWQAVDAEQAAVSDDRFAGKPRILIFYLGFGCLHCVEQLKAFSPMAEQYEQAGIELVGISSETVKQLQLGLENFDQELPLPLLADPEQKVFKQYACWDDFEQQPLHGTFLIDSAGKIRWQDISHEPFTDAAFLLKEANRLLALPQ
ncbi:peroxiredoxin family protein [Candidatus Laterigemmans baculatus]|uniref:peroxiredoxin family protein n=1 Tax=Candidatus Laterigemmans baculatus TaxID=2770505 RepID=UPI0013DC27BC|nr:peroxiredoxin family protein [Candidatus Laterigemmans baculatus]